MRQETNPNPERIPLGSTNLRISPMGIGTWSWGDSLYWGFGHGYDATDIQAAFQVSLKYGVNFFDTAEFYGFGNSERLLGRLKHSSSKPIIVTTKFIPYPWRLSRESLMRALRGSLQRLNMDKLDLYLIHVPLPPVPIKTWMNGLADAVEAGLVSAVGVSNYNQDQMRRAHAALSERGIPLACNQVDFSLLKPQAEHNGILDTCRELDVTLVAYSPLAQGLLTGKYTSEYVPKGIRNYRIRRKTLSRVGGLIEVMKEVGQNHEGVSPAQVAINWVMCKGAVPIPGAKNARQAEENLGALGWSLTEDEIRSIEEEAQKVLL